MLISVTRTPPLENGVVDLITPATTPVQRRSPSPVNTDKATEDREKKSTAEKTKQKGPETKKIKEDMETNSSTENTEMTDAEKILKQDMKIGDQTLIFPE